MTLPDPALTSRRALFAAAAMLVLLIGLLSGTAVAEEHPNDWIPITGVERLPGPAEYTDYSGGVLETDGRLLVIDNGEDDIIEYIPDPNGGWSLGRIFDLGSISDPVDDLEDITRLGNNRYAIIDENDNTLTVLDLPISGTDVSEVYTVALWPFVDNFAGNGIEGLFYSFEESVGDVDTFYVASEVNALVVRLDIVDGTVINRGADTRLHIPAASALHRMWGTDTMYVVANRTRSIYRFRNDGVQLGPPMFLAGFDNPEGLTFSDDYQRMIVIGESRNGGNQIQEFARTTAPIQTTIAQIASGSGDSTQRVDGSIGLLEPTLSIGPGLLGEAGVHFTEVCVPKGAEIRRAALSFVPAASGFDAATIEVVADRRAEAPGLDTAHQDLSNRPRTARSATGFAGSWNGGRTTRAFAPDTAEVIAELVALPDWDGCGDVTLRVTSNGLRTARARDNGAELAPTLIIDWQPVTNANVTITTASSCLAGAGRVDATFVNNGVSTVTINATFSGLPDRARTIPAGSSTAVTWTGRRNGRYGVGAEVAGALVSLDPVEVACAPDVTTGVRCLAGNGVLDFRIANTAGDAATYVINVPGLAPRTTVVGAWGEARRGISGRPDRDYPVVISRNGVTIATPTLTVDCDPDIIVPTDPVVIRTSCLAGNGRIDVDLYNPTNAVTTYRVIIGTLSARVVTLGPEARSTVTVTGRRDGVLNWIVLRDSEPFIASSVIVACD